MGLLDFFSQEAGQGRRKWLDGQTQDMLEALQFYAGPGVDVESTAGLLSMFNPVQDVGEAMRDTRDGDYIGAAANTLSALAPVGAYKLAGAGATDDIANVLQDTLMGFGMKAEGAADAGRRFAADEFGGAGPGKQGIRAYHGSPHSFDRFSMDAIGTGEGAQAYGHGLYFAENEAVARGYRDNIGTGVSYKGQPIMASRQDGTMVNPVAHRMSQTGEDAATAMQSLAGKYKTGAATALRRGETPFPGGDPVKFAAEYEQMAEDVLRLDPSDFGNSGSMYEVNINANPDDFLDWDAPLNQQGPRVQQAWQDYTKKNPRWLNPDDMGGDYINPTGYSFLGAYSEDVPYNRVDPFVYSRKFTDDMSEQGIPGIKYRDAGSRGVDGDGTRNFVVFDENLIEIVKKYGIAGAAAMLGVSAADVEDAINGT